MKLAEKTRLIGLVLSRRKPVRRQTHFRDVFHTRILLARLLSY